MFLSLMYLLTLGMLLGGDQSEKATFGQVGHDRGRSSGDRSILGSSGIYRQGAGRNPYVIREAPILVRHAKIPEQKKSKEVISKLAIGFGISPAKNIFPQL